MNLFASFAQEVVWALAPLRHAVEDSGALELLLEQIGTWPAAVDQVGLLSALAAAGDAIATVETASDAASTIAAVQAVLEATRSALAALRAVRTADPSSSLAEVGRDLLALLAARHLRLRTSRAYQAAVALGIVQVRPILSAPGLRRPAFVEQLDAAQLAALARDPVEAIRSQLPPDPLSTRARADETADLVAMRSAGLLRALGLPGRYGVDPGDAAWVAPGGPRLAHMLTLALPSRLVGQEELGITVALSPADEADLGVVIRPFGAIDLERTLFDWTVSFGVDADVQAFAFGGGHGFQLLADPGTTEVRATFSAARATEAPMVIGATDGTRLELEGLRFHSEAVLSAAQRMIDLGFAIERGLFVATSDGGDGFLGRVLGDRELRAEFDFGVAYTSGRGLRFKGGAGLEVRIPAGVTVGPVTLDEVAIALEVSAEALRLVASCGVQVTLGPVQVRVNGVGTRLVATLPGEARDFDLDFDFQAPDGAGFVIDAGPVRGGGYLTHAAGRYTGALALEVLGLSLSAIGILDTHVPGTGYSLAAVISAEFSPIQLGMGFTLDGVGGLIGIHRRIDTDALRAALRGPGIGDIFFAADPIGQAARLTGDLGRYFPAAEGRYVFGPAVKIGWGTPTMVTGTLAVLLELPSPVRVVLLGSVHAALPTQDHAVIDLHVDVVGEVDFGEKRIAIDASLRESTIAGFPITGDLAFRMRWGDAPSFALAIGGFHSQFRAPPGFPALRRIRIPIGSGDDPRLDIQGFLALTSNTAQVGAQAELYASAGPLNIRGSLGFETLIVFSPFSLQVDVWAGVKLRRGNSTLAGIHFDGRISGPGPWRIDGKATLSLWFVDLSVGVHVSFGSGHPVELPTRTIWPLLLAEVQRPASWSGELGAGMSAVATATPPGEAVARIDPGATLTLRQKIVPLDRRITRFAQGRPDGVNEFRVTGVVVGSHSTSFGPVSDWFAPAQFEELSDADKLSRAGFERMTAGVTADEQIRAGAPLTKVLAYETVIWAEGKRQGGAPYRPSYDAQLAGTAVSAVAQAPVRRHGAAAYAPPSGTQPRFVLEEEAYMIASVSNLQARLDLSGRVTRGQAELALRAHLAAAPGDAGALQVVPAHEAAA